MLQISQNTICSDIWVILGLFLGFVGLDLGHFGDSGHHAVAMGFGGSGHGFGPFWAYSWRYGHGFGPFLPIFGVMDMDLGPFGPISGVMDMD